ncbi:MAG: hypothetical protein RL264_1619 [Bacteroidota bacterium]|jgi:HEPN domain-containing protein
MEEGLFNKSKIIEYWLKSSDEDFETMLIMFENKKYSWSLFIGHLMIEKLLKAVYVGKKNNHPPFTHNLLRLAQNCSLTINEVDKEFYATVTAFNIIGRYDDYKMSFHQICTKEFAESWIEKIKEKRKWIKEQMK